MMSTAQVCLIISRVTDYQQYRSGFFGSDAPPPFLPISWDVMSQCMYKVKQRGQITKLGRWGCYLALTGRRRAQKASFRCTQSNMDICTHPLIKTVSYLSPLSMNCTCVSEFNTSKKTTYITLPITKIPFDDKPVQLKSVNLNQLLMYFFIENIHLYLADFINWF